ncbi:MAG: hypothetical protein DHS20C02_15380 [Micavibrio sp.]|nr:MAG: hypothetical protein DHS20C02_15380 [Micavibrio sp.]
MYNIEREPSEYLLACFFAECETQFRFLETKHGFKYFSGLVDYKGGRQIITPYKNQTIENGFQAMTRYEKDDDAFEIIFDDMYLSLEGYAYYNRINRFEFSEVLEAAKKTDSVLTGKKPVHHRDGVREAIEQIATPFKNHIKHFVAPTPKLIERALTMRGKRIEHKVRSHYEAIVQEACAKAAKAFLKKNYQSVIELLSPYERDLSAADLKKLEKAKKNCQMPL